MSKDCVAKAVCAQQNTYISYVHMDIKYTIMSHVILEIIFGFV